MSIKAVVHSVVLLSWRHLLSVDGDGVFGYIVALVELAE